MGDLRDLFNRLPCDEERDDGMPWFTTTINGTGRRFEAVIERHHISKHTVGDPPMRPVVTGIFVEMSGCDIGAVLRYLLESFEKRKKEVAIAEVITEHIGAPLTDKTRDSIVKGLVDRGVL